MDSISGGVGSALSGGNFFEGALIGGVVAGLNDAMHKHLNGGDPPRKRRKILSNSSDAVDHYYNGNGEDAEIGMGAKRKLISNSETKRVINRLISGEANSLSNTFDVDLTNSYEGFHIGDTNVDYSTSCTISKCTTSFKAFVRDGFWDPLDIGIEIGGKPYNYVPWEFKISYKNPGYPKGNNIKTK
ncbi:hypothetical protein ACF3NR_08715 [Vaginella massiliensis]|uniref:hypothetical protein n=1 Tax=Vaginella massiliensis TaxID=1816680 RepID=UPI0008382CD2|nr:hypothetical protein [Vaginella massiliensis]